MKKKIHDKGLRNLQTAIVKKAAKELARILKKKRKTKSDKEQEKYLTMYFLRDCDGWLSGLNLFGADILERIRAKCREEKNEKNKNRRGGGRG